MLSVSSVGWMTIHEPLVIQKNAYDGRFVSQPSHHVLKHLGSLSTRLFISSIFSRSNRSIAGGAIGNEFVPNCLMNPTMCNVSSAYHVQRRVCVASFSF